MTLIEWPKESSVPSKRIVGSQQKNHRCSAKESSVLSKRIVGARQKNRRCSAKESSVLGKRIVGSQQKNRRFSAKESSVLSKRIDGAKRKQSIYSQILLNCYAVGGSNAGPKHSKIIVFPLGFREAFSLLPSCLCGFIWSNTVELGGFGKDTCFFDEMQYPYEDTEQPYFFMTDDNGDIQEWFP